jgi:hypothetical protein
MVAVLLGGCATTPLGPTAMVMPEQGKPFEVFAQDQAVCKQFAAAEVDGGAATSNLKQLGTAVISTALGAGLGAATWRQHGAEFGSAVGAIGGTAAAAHGSAADQNGLQGRYNLAYVQCMYAHGNQIAGAAASGQRVARAMRGAGPVPEGGPAAAEGQGPVAVR